MCQDYDKSDHFSNSCFVLQDLFIKKNQENRFDDKPIAMYTLIGIDTDDLYSALPLDLSASHHLISNVEKSL